MGNESSSSQRASKDLTGFSSTERLKLEEFYQRLGLGHRNSKAAPGESETLLENYLKDFVSSWLAKRLAKLISHGVFTSSQIRSKSNGITPHLFYSALSHLLRGTVDHQASAILHLSQEDPSNTSNSTSTKDLLKLAMEILRSYFDLNKKNNSEDMELWSRHDPTDEELFCLAEFTLSDLLFESKKQKVECQAVPPEKSFSHEDLVVWLSHTNVFMSYMNYVMCYSFPVLDAMEKSMIPPCLGREAKREHTDLVNLVSVTMITQSIPVDCRDKWTLLFDSRQHGESYTNMLRNVKHQKNTVLVVRDKSGQVFGGFSTAVWSNHAAFQGSNNNFLFSLSPTLDVYKPTGLNSNYFYLNSGQETLPNGMGMGGQLEYFGLWLDNEFGTGHSMAKPLSTTYHNPTLSAQPHFEYHELEVWRVSGLAEEEDDDETDDNSQAKAATSILDSDAGAKAILNMVGRGNLSEGLRESDPTASNPEEHEKPVI